MRRNMPAVVLVAVTVLVTIFFGNAVCRAQFADEDQLVLEYKFEQGLVLKQTFTADIKTKINIPKKLIKSMQTDLNDKMSKATKGKKMPPVKMPEVQGPINLFAKMNISGETLAETVLYEESKKEAIVKHTLKRMTTRMDTRLGGKANMMSVTITPDKMTKSVNGVEEEITGPITQTFKTLFQPVRFKVNTIGVSEMIDKGDLKINKLISKEFGSFEQFFVLRLPANPISKDNPVWEFKEKKSTFFTGEAIDANLHARYRYMGTTKINGVLCAKIKFWNIFFANDIPASAMPMATSTDKFNLCMKNKGVAYVALGKGYVKKVEFKLNLTGTLGYGVDSEILKMDGKGEMTSDEVRPEDAP